MLRNAILLQLAMDAGVHLPDGMQLIPDNIPTHNYRMAADALPTLVTTSNSGIPSYLANYIDPKVIQVLLSPMQAAVIAGERKVGDWTTATSVFPMVENTGETSSYGDFSENGRAGANMSFPSRESYHYQTITQWGERELEIAALARVDWASQMNISSALTLNKYQNLTYFFGISGLKLYGLLNDPSLPASILPTAAWSLATSDVTLIYEDIRRLFVQLQSQLNGNLQTDSKMCLAMSNTAAVALQKTSAYNAINVEDMVRKNFPNMRFEYAPEYATTSGQLVQLIAEDIDGQKTLECAFTEKMRAHRVVPKESSFSQKKTQGTWGAIIYRPIAVASMLGV